MAIRSDIPVGKDFAISRKELARLWQCDERMVRREIAALRRTPGGDGFCILSTSGACPGYWRSSDPVEIRAFIQETENRARSTFGALKEARQVLKQYGR